jgi:hypothetical protein
MIDMNEIDLEAFEGDYRDAKVYHRRLEQFLEEGQHSSVVFNVAAVALERYLVALCELYGVEPGNHNYTCLMDAAEKIIDFPMMLNKEIRSLDLIFGICSLDGYHHGEPERSDSDRVLLMCNEVQELFDQTRISAIRDVIKNIES